MKCIKSCEDYDCWLRALNHTNIIYLKDICFYYEGGGTDMDKIMNIN
jgi:hypothetical protein